MKDLYVLDERHLELLREATKHCDSAEVPPMPEPAKLAGPAPVILLKLEPERFGTPELRGPAIEAYLAGFRELCAKHGCIVLLVDKAEDLQLVDDAFMARHGWSRIAKPKFTVGQRVYSPRHGMGEVLSVEDMAGFGWCYRLRLDSGKNTGGAVPEDKLQGV